MLGASFSNHTGIYPGKPIIQVDLDPLQLGKFHPVTVPVWGEIGVVLRDPAASGSPRRRPTGSTSAPRWPSAGAIWRAEKASRERDDRGHGINSAIVFAALGRHVPEDAVIAVDVGNHAYSFGRYFECRPSQSVLMSGYLGSIGFGYPAAIGAWAAAPDRPIFAVTGDGGFAQYMAELLTAVKHRHEDHTRAAQQRPAREDLQRAARRRLGGVADLAAQSELLPVRARSAVRSESG